ncbi:tetratricopeptide repeat protein [Actinomadura keratinilytica]|uniref:tetratricopeptide repeat protein n=1 Tax=Actinomadura keratinilytica TaxID=547461 RepID=UPI0031E65623
MSEFASPTTTENSVHDPAAYARQLMDRGDIDAALPWLERAGRAGDASCARTLAAVLRDRGDYERAERWYRAAADRDGGCAFGLAVLLEKSGDTAGAARWYARGAELGSAQCRTAAALLSAAQGRQDEAERLLGEALAAGDRTAGQALEAMERFRSFVRRGEDTVAEAVAGGDHAMALDAVAELGRDVAGFRAYASFQDDAVRLFDKVADAADDNRPLVWKGLLLERVDRWDEARRALEEAARRYPGRPYAPFTLGVLCRERGLVGEAEHWLKRGAALADASSMWELAGLCLRQRRFAEARDWYTAYGEHAGDDDHRDVEGALERVEAQRRTAGAAPAADAGRLDGLRAATEGGSPDAAVELAGLLEEAGRFAEAARWYGMAAETGDVEAGLALGELLYGRCEAEPRHVVGWFLPAAAAAYERARAASEPDEADVRLVERAGHLLLIANDAFNAERWLRRAARLGHGKAAWWCGDRSEEYGDVQEAERMWALAARRGVAWCGWPAGRSMVRRGAYAEAEPLLRLAWDGRHDEPPLHEAAYWLGLSLRGQGRLEEAARWLRTAVDVHHRVRTAMGTARFDPRAALAEVLDEVSRRDEQKGEAGRGDR